MHGVPNYDGRVPGKLDLSSEHAGEVWFSREFVVA